MPYCMKYCMLDNSKFTSIISEKIRVCESFNVMDNVHECQLGSAPEDKHESRYRSKEGVGITGDDRPSPEISSDTKRMSLFLELLSQRMPNFTSHFTCPTCARIGQLQLLDQ